MIPRRWLRVVTASPPTARQRAEGRKERGGGDVSRASPLGRARRDEAEPQESINRCILARRREGGGFSTDGAMASVMSPAFFYLLMGFVVNNRKWNFPGRLTVGVRVGL